jgi:protocatechuate 3,4-dioxygenase beta subunit
MIPLIVLPIGLMTLSALVILALGTLHLVYTFRGPLLTPRDPALQARMSEVHPVITRQTTMWRAWVGFNASHSMGAILFGLVYGFLANAYPEILFKSPFLLAVGLATLGGFTVLGKRYWFRMPFTGIVISLVCYVASMLAWWSISATASAAEITACDRAGPQAEIPVDQNAAPLLLEGQVFQSDGRTPAAGILVYAHHTGANGLYDNGPDGAPRREAFMRTGTDGRFQLRTGRPAPYPNRTQPAHIHLHLWGPGVSHQWTDDVLFADDPLLTAAERQRSEAAGRFAWVTATPPEGGALIVRRAIRLKTQGDRFDPRMRFGLRTCGAS